MEEFRLHHVRKNKGDSLSGGERRRTEIARALAVDPKFILLDEPFAGVDPIAVEDIQSVVARLKYKNIGILITDHNVNETLSICDRAYLLIEGKIFKHGTAEQLADDEQVRRLYLGRNFELKRKDYLHEEAMRGIKGPELNAVIELVKNAISWGERIVEKDGLLASSQLSEANNGLGEYSKSLETLQTALLEYARLKNDKDLEEKSKLLLTENSQLSTSQADLNSILSHLSAIEK